jgi:biopolymer transport protein ExbD
MKKDDELGPIVLIKADENVKYKNFVDIIDEMAITNIARYSVVELNTVEKKMIADFKAGKSGTATK